MTPDGRESRDLGDPWDPQDPHVPGMSSKNADLAAIRVTSELVNSPTW